MLFIYELYINGFMILIYEFKPCIILAKVESFTRDKFEP